MRYTTLEIGSSWGIILLMILAPSIVLYASWHAFLGLDVGNLGGAEFMKTVQKSEVSDTVSNFEKILEPFLTETLKAQVKAFGNGIKTILLGSFLTLSTLTSITFCRVIAEGSIINEIGLLRNKRRVFFERTLPLFLYAGLVSSLLSLGVWILLPFAGVEATPKLLASLFLSTLMASLWGIFLTAFIGATLKDNLYPLLSSFLVAGIFLFASNYGEILFPFIRTFELVLSGGYGMNLTTMVGLSMFAVSPLAALKAFERGEYY
ncbi:hypothetical protein A3L09_09145 [Thermococcus profundus]|uniref:Uncharacterized protein n=1 Tax=Thermococcus profundus TaxID=49899 RepID=A0A2Z2MF96_THEPR|nr:hypothetical protein [Thermococcus profundus]ASJ03412.1 hypothetical protein A3L09_09145 [Thermococcus profundus]